MMQLPPGYLEFSVRKLHPGDEAGLSEFYHALSESSRHFFEPYRDISVEAMRTVIERTVQGVDLGMIAIDPAGTVFAHFFFGDIERPAPHLGIGVRDEYQDLGLGSLLFGYLISLAKNVLKKTEIGLTVMKKNQRAVHLYQKSGFTVVRDVTFRTPDDSYEMRRML
jgi:ribosomal protein S18 acetylase RimI-like enzyme